MYIYTYIMHNNRELILTKYDFRFSHYNYKYYTSQRATPIHVFYTTNKYISRRYYKGGIGYGVELNEK